MATETIKMRRKIAVRLAVYNTVYLRGQQVRFQPPIAVQMPIPLQYVILRLLSVYARKR